MDRDKINKLITAAINSPLQRAIIGIFIVILAYLFYQLMLGRYIRQLDSLSEQLITQKRLLQTKQESIKTLPAYEKSQKSWEEKLTEVNKVFFTETEGQRFIDELPKIIIDSGNNVGYLKPFLNPPPSQNSNLTYDRKVDLSVSGTYINLISLFESFRKYGKLLEVESLRIAATSPTKLITQFSLKYFIISR